jgi:hypothetical protein
MVEPGTVLLGKYRIEGVIGEGAKEPAARKPAAPAAEKAARGDEVDEIFGTRQ